MGSSWDVLDLDKALSFALKHVQPFKCCTLQFKPPIGAVIELF